MFERIDIVEQMCEYGLQLLEHLFEGVVMRSKSIVQVQAKTVSELWSIASRFPGDSSSAYQRVERLKQVNNLRGGSLRAGQHLVIPL